MAGCTREWLGAAAIGTLALAASALAGTPANAEKSCEDGATNMAEVRACLYMNVEKDLEATYNDTLRFVRGKDGKAALLLEKAQGSWKSFLENSCEYATAARQTDAMSNDARFNCFADFAHARIRVLKAYKREFGKTDR